MFIPIVLFLLGLLCLIKGGDWFVDGSVGLAHRFRLPELLIGATVVSIGTTLPEVMVSANAAISGASSIAYGNAIGSVICNTALIAALTTAIHPSKCQRRPLVIPVLFFYAAAAIYAIAAYLTGTFSRGIGLLLLCLFLIYMVYTVRTALTTKIPLTETSTAQAPPLFKSCILLIFGAVLIAFGANLLVENGTALAKLLGVPESVIALTFVALGTSLPELVTAVTSLIKGHSALSLGNIIGANLFNLVLVSGLAISISPFDLPSEKLLLGHNASLIVDVPLMIAVVSLLALPAIVRGRLSRLQGIVLLIIYAAYCMFQFVL